jgi:hypothetical protein
MTARPHGRVPRQRRHGRHPLHSRNDSKTVHIVTITRCRSEPLKVRDVGFALGTLAKRLSTRSVRLARMILIQAIRNAMVNDLVVRNVADLAAVPTGSRNGRPDLSTWSRLWPCWTQPGENAYGPTSP